MPPKKKKAAKEPDHFGLSAEGPVIVSTDDVVQRLKERVLMDRVSKLELQNRSLLTSNKELKVGLEETTSEQADVYVYLHRKLDENYGTIESLEDKLEDLEEENERLKTLAESEIKAHEAERQAEVNDLRRQLQALTDELAALAELRAHREHVQSEMARMKAELEEEKRERALEVAELERRNVAAKEKLKKEMFAKIKETKRAIMASTNEQLHHTTVRTMAENEQIATELTYQSKETEKVLAVNTRLRSQNTELRREHELLCQSRDELVKRTHFFQKLVKKLHEKLRLAEERERVMKDAGMSGNAHRRISDMEALILQLHSQISTLSAERDEAIKGRDALQSEVDHLQGERAHREAIEDDTIAFLVKAMDDLRASALASGTPLVGQGVDERLKTVEMLLSRLHLYQSAAAANPYRTPSRPPSRSPSSPESKLDGSSSRFPPLRGDSRGEPQSAPKPSTSPKPLEARPPSLPTSEPRPTAGFKPTRGMRGKTGRPAMGPVTAALHPSPKLGRATLK